jgi:hypothetical protein
MHEERKRRQLALYWLVTKEAKRKFRLFGPLFTKKSQQEKASV